MDTTKRCGGCDHYQTHRDTSMAKHDMHSCAKGRPWTYYDRFHPCHWLEAQPVPDRPASPPPRGQIGLIGNNE